MTSTLNDLMAAKKLTTRGLMDKLPGYSFQAVSAWRQGVRMPSYGAVEVLAKALGLSPEKVTAAVLASRAARKARARKTCNSKK